MLFRIKLCHFRIKKKLYFFKMFIVADLVSLNNGFPMSPDGSLHVASIMAFLVVSMANNRVATSARRQALKKSSSMSVKT